MLEGFLLHFTLQALPEYRLPVFPLPVFSATWLESMIVMIRHHLSVNSVRLPVTGESENSCSPPDSSGSQTLAREVQHVASLRSHYRGGTVIGDNKPLVRFGGSEELDWQERIAEINSLLEIGCSSGLILSAASGLYGYMPVERKALRYSRFVNASLRASWKSCILTRLVK